MPQNVPQASSQASHEATISDHFSCPICLELQPKAELFTPSGCNHRLCRSCARQVVLNAARSLDFPIDCPVCRLERPEEQEEQVQQLQQSTQQSTQHSAQHSAQQVQGSASQHSYTLTAANRSLSDNVSAQLGMSQHVTGYTADSGTVVDPNHATQLHAVASTPSLGSTGHFADAGENPFIGYDEDEDTRNGFQFLPQQVPPNGFPPNGFLPHGPPPNRFSLQPATATAHVRVDSIDSPGSKSMSPAYVSARPDHTAAVQFDLSQPRKGMPRVPSFPIIASGTPMTPILIPADGGSLDSRAIFSPHQPSTAPVPNLASDLHAEPSRVSANPADTHTGHAASQQPPAAYPTPGPRVPARAAGPNGTHTLNPEEIGPAELGMRSLSLGGLTNAPLGVTRGLSSPADWSAADYSRSSSLSSGVSRGVSNVEQLRPLRSQRGSLDADVHMLLNDAELEEYLSKSLKAAAHRYGSLVQCPKADCAGVASLPQMEPHFQCPKCSYEWCRWCHQDWHEGIRCKKEPYYIEPQAAGSRYIPEQAKPIQPQHSRYIPERQKEARHKRPKGKRGLSIGSMGELISRSMKGTMGTMIRMGSGDLADAGTSLNKYLKRNRVLECPTCKNGITKVEGGCNHIMCAVCKTHICWLCGSKICQGVNNYWDANRHFWIKGTKCYGQIQTVAK